MLDTICIPTNKICQEVKFPGVLERSFFSHECDGESSLIINKEVAVIFFEIVSVFRNYVLSRNDIYTVITDYN